MRQKYLKCEKCGNMVALVKKNENDIVCCGEPMKELVAGEVDAAKEKHIPIYSIDNGKVTVKVGEVEHPSTEEHHIEWISIQTKAGNQRKAIKPGDEANAEFLIDESDEIEAVYAYCNLHGLWKA